MKIRGLLSAFAALAVIGTASPGSAQVEPFVGQVIMVGFSFCPQGWLDANGQLLPISSYQALFALLGTTYGGNGTTNFKLPDLQGRVAMGQGNGAGLPPAVQGQILGAPTTTLTIAQLPAHNHQLMASNASPNVAHPSNAFLANFTGAQNIYASTGPAAIAMGQGTVGVTGGNLPFDQHQPSLVLRYCIAYIGVFPTRN